MRAFCVPSRQQNRTPLSEMKYSLPRRMQAPKLSPHQVLWLHQVPLPLPHQVLRLRL